MESEVFDRTNSPGKLISPSKYNLTIGLVLGWGFLVNWLTVKFIPTAAILHINPWVFFIGYFVLCFLGVFLFNKSANPVVSFIGYNLVVVPFGFVINLVVSQYSNALVLDAVRITGIVTFLMMLLGSMYPGFFQDIIDVLVISLLLVIVVELVEIFILGVHHGFIDWIVVLIFCGYVGFDWGRANSIPKTFDNAVDSAAELYMDIINLFIRILRILGRRS